MFRNSIKQIVQRRHFSLHDATVTFSTVHAAVGIPWWAFIPLTTFAVRALITFPIAIIHRRGLQRQNELRPITKAMAPVFRLKLAQAAQEAQSQRDALLNRNPNTKLTPSPVAELTADKIAIITAKEKIKRQRKLFKEYNVQSFKFLVLPFIQMPLWIGLSLIYRSITGWSDLGLEMGKSISQGGNFDPTISESFLHVSDMANADPYFIAPIILGIVALANAEWNFKTAQLMNLTQSNRQLSGQISRPKAFDVVMTLSRAGLIFLTAVSTQAPFALVWYWICSNLFSLGQNILLDKYIPLKYIPESRFRRWGKVDKTATPILTDKN